MPLPGMPTVARTPRLPTFTVAPGAPNDALNPCFPIFKRTPGNSVNVYRKRSPIFYALICFLKVRERAAYLAAYIYLRLRRLVDLQYLRHRYIKCTCDTQQRQELF